MAMHVRTSIMIAAWSDDGTSVLLQINDSGPEGGGAESYRLLSAKAPTDMMTVLSSNFSNGAQENQTISAKARQAALTALVAALKAKGFSGVSSDGQNLFLPSPAKGTPVVVETAAKGGAQRDAVAKLRIVLEGSSVRIEAAGRPVASVRCLRAPYNEEKSYHTEAVLSPTGKLLVLISSSTALGIDALCGLFASPSGQPAELRAIELPGAPH